MVPRQPPDAHENRFGVHHPFSVTRPSGGDRSVVVGVELLDQPVVEDEAPGSRHAQASVTGYFEDRMALEGRIRQPTVPRSEYVHGLVWMGERVQCPRGGVQLDANQTGHRGRRVDECLDRPEVEDRDMSILPDGTRLGTTAHRQRIRSGAASGEGRC